MKGMGNGFEIFLHKWHQKHLQFWNCNCHCVIYLKSADLVDKCVMLLNTI